MIIRPEGLELVEVSLVFNLKIIERLEIDLAHVNKAERSKYKASEVAFLIGRFINHLELPSSSEKIIGGEICHYFVSFGEIEGKKYKLVFCTCSDRPKTIGVITLYRM